MTNINFRQVYTIFTALWAILGLFVASSGPKTAFISNYGLIMGKDSMRIIDMGMKIAIESQTWTLYELF